MNGVNTHNVRIAFAHEESHHSNRDNVILRQYENDENSIISIIENGKYTNLCNFSQHTCLRTNKARPCLLSTLTFCFIYIYSYGQWLSLPGLILGLHTANGIRHYCNAVSHWLAANLESVPVAITRHTLFMVLRAFIKMHHFAWDAEAISVILSNRTFKRTISFEGSLEGVRIYLRD